MTAGTTAKQVTYPVSASVPERGGGRMTERYAHLAPGNLQEAVQRLNRVAEVAPEVAPAPEEPRQAVIAGAEKPEASRDDVEDGRYWDRTSGPRLVRAMLFR
jgi:hypothetical protein